MPEGPELYLAGHAVNEICKGLKFSGKVKKSNISKYPFVCWEATKYNISAKARGKEVKLTLIETQSTQQKATRKITRRSIEPKTVNIIFRYGLTGKLRFDRVEDLHKHAHLNFYTADKKMVLSYVDTMRYGSWEVSDNWGRNRGPCVLNEYQQFRYYRIIIDIIYMYVCVSVCIYVSV